MELGWQLIVLFPSTFICLISGSRENRERMVGWGGVQEQRLEAAAAGGNVKLVLRGKKGVVCF